MHVAERVIAEHLFDFAALVESRIGLKRSLIDTRATDILLLGLQTQGAHHKQYALYQLAKVLELEHFMGNIEDKGIAP